MSTFQFCLGGGIFFLEIRSSKRSAFNAELYDIINIVYGHTAQLVLHFGTEPLFKANLLFGEAHTRGLLLYGVFAVVGHEIPCQDHHAAEP